LARLRRREQFEKHLFANAPLTTLPSLADAAQADVAQPGVGADVSQGIASFTTMLQAQGYDRPPQYLLPFRGNA
jgi:hypothetical protein